MLNELESIYHMWSGKTNPVGLFSYKVKIRPFCREFLIEAMGKFDIYFYTAATRSYGEVAVDILRMEVSKGVEE